MKKIRIYLAVMFLCVSISSCHVTRVTVGDGPVGKTTIGKEKYARAKQFHLFWGFMSLGHSQPAMPSHKDMQIKESFNVGDMFVTGITGGIVSSRTITVYVKK